MAYSDMEGGGRFGWLAVQLIGPATVMVTLAVGAGIGYLVDPTPHFGDSVGAGIGIMAGLAVWLVGAVYFICVGGITGWKERRASRG